MPDPAYASVIDRCNHGQRKREQNMNANKECIAQFMHTGYLDIYLTFEFESVKKLTNDEQYV